MIHFRIFHDLDWPRQKTLVQKEFFHCPFFHAKTGYYGTTFKSAFCHYGKFALLESILEKEWFLDTLHNPICQGYLCRNQLSCG
jgi:hypothetical protein